ncbi:PAS domain S-box protein [Candidatus Falkowbacteria bacterium]|nr:PAS domain S-box protein [Candidatus Falkowbacteria bacterium]
MDLIQTINLTALLQVIPDGIILVAPDRQILFANVAASRLTGLPQQGFYLAELARLLQAKVPVNLEDVVATALREKTSLYFRDVQIVSFFYEIFIDSVTDKDGKVLLAVIVLHNVSQYQKEKVLLESLGDGLIAIDRSFNITFFNKAASTIFGWSQKEAVGRPFREIVKLLRENDRKENITFVEETMLYGETRPVENNTLLVAKDGREIQVANTATPIFDSDNKVIGAVIIFRDTSKEHELEKMRQEFSSLATHQLRTPITVIRGSISMLLDGSEGPLTNEQKESLEDAQKANEELYSLVNAMLNVSRIESGTIAVAPEPFYLPDIADEIAGELSTQIKEKGLRFEKDYDKNLPSISVDRNLMSVIFRNLFSNAIKYTPDGGKFLIKIEKQEQNILIIISDTGVGIPKEQQGKMFNKFFRADNVSKTEGTGLGLYIVKSIVEQSGGKIRFESEENKGTTFSISIPLSGMIKRDGTKGLT